MTEPDSNTFWKKHWQWLVPLIFVGPVLIMTLTCGSFIWSIWELKKSLPAYQMTIDAMVSDPNVIEALGEPIVFDDMITGQVQIDGDQGQAHLQFGAAGPNGQGLIVSDAVMHAHQWSLTLLTFTVYENETATQTIKIIP